MEAPVHVKIAVGLAGPYIVGIMGKLQEYRVRCVHATRVKDPLPPIPDGVPYKAGKSVQRLAALGAWSDGPEQVFPHNIPLPPGTWRTGVNGFMVTTAEPYRRLVCVWAEPLAKEPNEKRIAHLSQQNGEWVFTFWAKETADGAGDPGAESSDALSGSGSTPVPNSELVVEEEKANPPTLPSPPPGAEHSIPVSITPPEG